MARNKTLWKQARLKLIQMLLYLVKMRPDYIKSIKVGGNSIHLTDEQATKFLNLLKADTEAVQ